MNKIKAQEIWAFIINNHNMGNKISSIINNLESNGLYNESDRLVRVAQDLLSDTKKFFSTLVNPASQLDDLIAVYETNRLELIKPISEISNKYNELKNNKNINLIEFHNQIDLAIRETQSVISNLQKLHKTISDFIADIYKVNNQQVQDKLPDLISEKLKVVKSKQSSDNLLKDLNKLKSLRPKPKGITIPWEMGEPDPNNPLKTKFPNIT